MDSILIIRFSSMGDVILATPIVRQLQQTYPDAVIDVAVASRFSGIYANNPRLRNVWSVDSSPTPDNLSADDVKLSMRDSVPGGHYDLIVDLQHNVRSAALRHGLGHNIALAPKYRLEKLALVWLKKKPRVISNIVSRYRESIEHLPLTLDTDGTEVWLPEEGHEGVYTAYKKVVKPKAELRIAIAPGAHHATKRWPAEKYGELVSKLVGEGASVTLLGGSSDEGICDAVTKSSGVDVERKDGATTIEETVRAIDTCDILVSNDSGVMHLGAARRKPVVGIFGSTVKELGFAPYGTPHVIVDHDVSCRPCSHIGRSSCPKGHFLCMNGIKVDQVVNAIDRLTA